MSNAGNGKAERSQLVELLALYKECDKERLQETEDSHEEAAHWKQEGDMYGWNFHEGKSSGTTHASIIFCRVRRRLEEMIKQEEHLTTKGT